ncbi:hypothetical protein FRC06_007047 [Ceratobasidium sp. 370]|nr:hypothetical protein FRC06_007047 [Ceratobasidium sp. 370]
MSCCTAAVHAPNYHDEDKPNWLVDSDIEGCDEVAQPITQEHYETKDEIEMVLGHSHDKEMEDYPEDKPTSTMPQTAVPGLLFSMKIQTTSNADSLIRGLALAHNGHAMGHPESCCISRLLQDRMLVHEPAPLANHPAHDHNPKRDSENACVSLLNIAIGCKKAANHLFLFDIAKVTKDLPEDTLQGFVINSGKIVLRNKLLSQLKQDGHRVLIFPQMVHLLDIPQTT